MSKIEILKYKLDCQEACPLTRLAWVDVTLDETTIRLLGLDEDDAITLVADRMGETLMEVLGEERGKAMYTHEWLVERVRWHIRSEEVRSCVLVAAKDSAHVGEIVGHILARTDVDELLHPVRRVGVLSTVYVVPAYRRQGLAMALLDAAEAWFCNAVDVLVTNTDAENWPLIGLYEGAGYRTTFRDEERHMVQLSKLRVVSSVCGASGR
jgi:ribosomal protein S18 acetylase RimI-like enzyme